VYDQALRSPLGEDLVEFAIQFRILDRVAPEQSGSNLFPVQSFAQQVPGLSGSLVECEDPIGLQMNQHGLVTDLAGYDLRIGPQGVAGLVHSSHDLQDLSRPQAKFPVDDRLHREYRPNVGDATSSAVSLRVPFVDVTRSLAPILGEIESDIAALLRDGRFAQGPAVAEFEERFADYCGAGRCVGVASGLDGLRLSLLAAGIEPGDEVIVPALTFAATFEAVVQAGGVPKPVDVSLEDLNLDVGAVESALTERTRFVMPVHLYGQPADMRSLLSIADKHGLTIIEDACQAHGAARGGLRAGSVGHAGVFSFYPTKNLGAIGDAGAVVTNDESLADQLVLLREHGQAAKYRHDEVGYTARLDTIQALVLLRKLPLLDRWNEERRAVANTYLEKLRGIGDLELPPVAVEAEHVWHLFVIRTEDPDALAAHLSGYGIGTGRHYPEPPHLSRAFVSLGHSTESFPIAEKVAAECLSLPIYAGITADEISDVADAVASYFDDA
jgi:dTDP-4-amino-4,6-dideoxygalactose transaminase